MTLNRVMVRYKCKADKVAENERLIADVFDELDRESPAGFRYASFKLEDGQTFVHIVLEEPVEAPRSLAEMPAFQAFTAGIEDRCEEPPMVSGMTPAGSYRFL